MGSPRRHEGAVTLIGSGRFSEPLIAVTVFLIPLWSVSFLGNAAALAFAVGLATAIGAAVVFPWPVVDRTRWKRPSTILAGSVAFFVVVGFMFNPSSAGAWLLGAAAIGAGLSLMISSFDHDRLVRLVTIPLSLALAIQTILACAQLAFDRPLVVTWLTGVEELSAIDGVTRPQGVFDHPYELVLVALLTTGLAIVSKFPDRWRWLRLVAAVSGGVAVAITYSRAGAIALMLVLLVAAVVARSDRPTLVVVASAVAAAVIASSIALPGWTIRIDQSAGSSLDEVSHGRVQQLQDAWTLVRQHPLFGVGPRLAEDHVEVLHPSEAQPFFVHNVPLLIAVELGILAGLAILGLLIAIAIAVVRSRGPAVVVFVALVPFLMVDHSLYSTPIGLVIWAVWGASITVLLPASSIARESDTIATPT